MDAEFVNRENTVVMKNYFKIIFAAKDRIRYAEECLSENFIGADYGVNTDIATYLSYGPVKFKNKFISLYLMAQPDKEKKADIVSETMWTFCNGIKTGDIVVCPNGKGVLYFGEVTGDYFFYPGGILQHRRPVRWLPATFRRKEISEELNASLKIKNPSLMITQHAEEIEKYIREYEFSLPPVMPMTAEKLLEDYLVENWKHTELGKEYNILEEDGEIVGQQYPTDTGPIDILAESKDKKELLVVELKKGRASDSVVGQINRYIGFVRKEVAKKDQLVKGVIVASAKDERIRYALLNTPNIRFLRYQVSLQLIDDSDA